tara:strand:- start:8165 stop:8635 length:471 start_codon:yes stop_codon:yes gene_type:complete
VLHCLYGVKVTQANESLTLALSGVIEDKCVIGIPGNVSFDFSQHLVHSTAIAIDCNQSMFVALRSEHGGLKLNKAEGKSALVVAYDIELKINSIKFKLMANSIDIKQEQRFSAGVDIPFATSASLKISLHEALTYAGKYSDTLHIEVYPNLAQQGI